MCKAVILPAVLYERIWNMVSESDGRSQMRAFENMIGLLWRIFLPKSEEETGGLKKKANIELHNLYPSLQLLRWSNKGGWDAHVAGMKTISSGEVFLIR